MRLELVGMVTRMLYCQNIDATSDLVRLGKYLVGVENLAAGRLLRYIKTNFPCCFAQGGKRLKLL